MLKILIVEDDPMVSSINKQYLKKVIPAEELEIFQVEAADQALSITLEKKPDLVLLDIYLPKVSGTELLNLFIENNLHPSVIMLSAAKDSNNINQARNYGVLDYLVKPFSFDRFQKAIQHFLECNAVLTQNNQLSQSQLDQIFVSGNTEAKPDFDNLPKGLSGFSLNKIKVAINKMPEFFSNQDLARKSKLSRITTKKYLDYLEENNMVTSKTHYLKVGRPTKLYKSNN